MQVKLDRAYTYKGKTYGPGEGVQVPDKIMEDEALSPAFLEELAGSAEKDELLAVDGIGEETAADLRRRGIESQDDLRAASDEDLLAVPGIGAGTLKKIRKDVD